MGRLEKVSKLQKKLMQNRCERHMKHPLSITQKVLQKFNITVPFRRVFMSPTVICETPKFDVDSLKRGSSELRLTIENMVTFGSTKMITSSFKTIDIMSRG